MSKFYGINPQPAIRQLVEKFENEIVIRYNNQPLVGNVYIDMQEHQWAVAFAYNYTHNPGLHGNENPLEVRYSCFRRECNSVRMYRSDPADEKFLETESFKDGDEFIRYAIGHERALVGRTISASR